MALAGIQDAKLYARFVGGGRHGAAQGIDFLDQMAFADAAYRRVARHLTQRFDVMREQQRTPAHARAGKRRLGAGMTAANHDYVKFFREMHAICCLISGRQ